VRSLPEEVFLKKEKHLKIYADENVNIAIVEGLKRRGIEACSAIEKNKLGLSDEDNWCMLSKRGRQYLRMTMIFSEWLLNLKLNTVE